MLRFVQPLAPVRQAPTLHHRLHQQRTISLFIFIFFLTFFSLWGTVVVASFSWWSELEMIEMTYTNWLVKISSPYAGLAHYGILNLLILADVLLSSYLFGLISKLKQRQPITVRIPRLRGSNHPNSIRVFSVLKFAILGQPTYSLTKRINILNEKQNNFF